MRKMFGYGCLIVTATVALTAGANPSKLVVHEWGTFLAMNGSDGITLDGMYHEEHALPAFVHARSRDELRMRGSNLKGETPVVYFYTDTPVQVSVEVKFPGGVWTQWYPQADFVGPTYVQTGSLLQPRNGRIAWTVDVRPAQSAPPTLPAAAQDALWNFSRDVDAAYVSSVDDTRPGARLLQGGIGGEAREWERFIFYRGLGQAPLPLALSAIAGGHLSCAADAVKEMRHVYVLRVENGRGVYRYLPSLRCGVGLDGVVPSMEGALEVDRFAAGVADDLAGRLVESGLYQKEARAMVNTWRTSYFMNDGIRVLFVLPQSWTDRFIPMTIRPKPDELVRVMVGRIELLSPERERAAETAVSGLASPDPQVRSDAFAILRDQGRYVEPIVRRAVESTTNEQVRTLGRRLLLTDFVTDIRSSLTSATDGRQLVQEPAFARAQLASLLREVGLHEEARQEGRLALKELLAMPRPQLTDHASRNTYRALGRANEGAGYDLEALRWYSEFVEFGSTFASCNGCHSLAGPTDTSFFRDWWAGRKFAELAWRTGEAPRLIEAAEKLATKKTYNSLLRQLQLAYLYEARDKARADRLWTQIEHRKERSELAP